MMIRKCLVAFLLLLMSILLFADTTPVLQRTGMEFDSTIPTFQSVVGYNFGERLTVYTDMEKYLQALVQSSRKVRLQKIGESYEGRALYYLILSSEQNMARLEDLRQANLRLSDPRALNAGQADAIIQHNPVFVNLSHAVHGNEHSSTESALALAYYLLAARDPQTAQILENCVVIIDPLQNPDGRERFIQHFQTNTLSRPNPDRNAAEHHESWPGGRYNHNLFDMNRDWTVLTQKETYARIQAYQQYQPEVFVDLHEMGRSDSTYFFPPPTYPLNPNVPRSQSSWWNRLGKAVAADFDRNRIPYFTEERFDFWYPGYGDSWPTYNGALAGTFEQASLRGLVIKRRDETTVHYQDAIWNHFLASLAVCKLSAANRQEKLRDFYDYRASAIQEGKTGPVKAYLLSRNRDPLLTDQLVRKLIVQGVEVKQLTSDSRINVRNYYDDRTELRTFQKGDFFLPMDQPLKRLIQVTFEKEAQFEKSFLEAEAKRRLEGESSELYDITAWAVPLAYGLEVYWTSEVLPSGPEPLNELPVAAPAIEAAPYAYLINYRSNEDVRAVIQLLERNVRIHFTKRPFTLNGHNYNAGSFVIRVKDNPENLHAILQDVASATGVTVNSTATGWTESGPDLGSYDMVFLKKPRVAVLTHLPTDPTSYGATAFLLDYRYQIPFVPLQTYMVSEVDLNEYDVIVMPDGGDWGTYDQMLGESGIKNLKAWIRQGGTLIAFQRASSFLIDNADLTSVKRIQRFLKDSTEPAPEKKEEETSPDDQETEAPDYIPGSIARMKLNRKHFLGYGYSSEEIPVFVNSDHVFYTPADEKPVGAYVEAERLKIAGLFWDISKERLAKKAYLTEEGLGEGHVILFAEDPNFRAYWEGLTRLFLNGLLFGPSL